MIRSSEPRNESGNSISTSDILTPETAISNRNQMAAASSSGEICKIPSAVAKNLRAKVFTISVDENNKKNATCNRCSKAIKMSNGNTTGLKRHLEKDHPEQYVEIYGIVAAKKIRKRQEGVSQAEFDIMLIDWAAKKYLPFSFFDDEGTQALFSYANPSLTVPKRDRFRSKTLERFTAMQTVIMKMLEDNASKLSFTVDGWTSVANKSYYGITVHFIDSQWNMRSLAIDFVPSNGFHTGRDIAKLFYETLKEHHILEKVQGITLDNASANTVFLSELSPLMAAENICFDPVNQHFRCFAHVINLAVNDMLRVIQSDIDTTSENDDDVDEEGEEKEAYHVDCTRVLTKLKTLFKKIKYSEQLTKKLSSCCETTNIKLQSPNIGVATRWNSTCDMILTAIQMSAALDLLCDNNVALKIYRLSETEWSLLRKLVKYLGYFKALSNVFSGETYATLPLVVIGVNMIIDKLEALILSYQNTSISNPVDDIIHDASIAARDKLIKHYIKTNWIYGVVLILDPRHKIKMFERTTWGKEMANECIEQFERIYRTCYYNEQVPTNDNMSGLEADVDTIESPSPDCSPLEDDVIDIGSLFESTASISTQGSGWRKEIDNYIRETHADRAENILQWWRAHETNFPILAKMARDFLCVQATSVSVERFFSKASLVIRKHRNRLNNESARSLLCLNSWLSCSLSKEILDKMEQSVEFTS